MSYAEARDDSQDDAKYEAHAQKLVDLKADAEQELRSCAAHIVAHIDQWSIKSVHDVSGQSLHLKEISDLCEKIINIEMEYLQTWKKMEGAL